ncbi:MAG: CsbD family protein [Desulfosudaceae bacterium]
MTENQLKGDWKETRGKAKERWGKLTEEDLEEINGQRDKLALRIEKLYGIDREEAEAQIREWEGVRV